eukprot:6455690-Amphidinium_carterae.1
MLDQRGPSPSEQLIFQGLTNRVKCQGPRQRCGGSKGARATPGTNFQSFSDEQALGAKVGVPKFISQGDCESWGGKVQALAECIVLVDHTTNKGQQSLNKPKNDMTTIEQFRVTEIMWANGVMASHLLRLWKALGSDPSIGEVDYTVLLPDVIAALCNLTAMIDSD